MHRNASDVVPFHFLCAAILRGESAMFTLVTADESGGAGQEEGAI